ncbi:cysteine hydrolase family protein [Nocardia bovistercoris]|uniref:Cysteine hydrolase n=1 Tax=Nocardia bovistercoris TaxID=2785916 RepID=A0A931IFS0_9NOCA|nr:cysteine hydrolase [Nocardia bovistercoris]MBH0780506.1 cysteine hydrolase [Nocardia bovistercoris]
MSALDPTRTALLVMDYQVAIADQLPDTGALLDRLTTAVSDIRSRGGRIGWVRVAFEDSDFDAIPPSSVWAPIAEPQRRARFHIDSPATAVHPALDRRPEDIDVRKTRVGAFTTTDLDHRLREHDITTLLLAGISTSGVVLSTVREAMDRDYRVTVLADACADPDPDLHAVLTRTVFPRGATVVTVGELSS